MDPTRADLDQLQSNTKYIFLTVVLVILSIIGVFLFFKIRATPPEAPQSPQKEVTQPVSSEPIEVVDEFIPAPEVSQEPVSASGSNAEIPAEIIPESTPQPSSTPIPEPAEGTPYLEEHRGTPAFQTYDSLDDGFTVSYMSDRKVYKIAEPTGYRVAFYRIGGNIAVHVGTDWSWAYPSRQLLATTPISGQPAFRYDIAAQTLVDVKYGNNFYTIQCVHNGDETLKSECEQFIISFKLL